MRRPVRVLLGTVGGRASPKGRVAAAGTMRVKFSGRARFGLTGKRRSFVGGGPENSKGIARTHVEDLLRDLAVGVVVAPAAVGAAVVRAARAVVAMGGRVIKCPPPSARAQRYTRS
jgi:hypothetical protein